MQFISDCTRYFKWRLIAKTLLVMKFSVIILLCACMQVSARGYAQSVSLSEKNASLEKVFRNIEKQTGYVFFFDHSLVDKAARVNVNFKNYPLDLALDLCLKELPLTYSIVGKNIVIKQKETSVVQQIIYSEKQQDTTITVTGKVVDEKGTGLPGASVMVKNTSVGTATNAEGAFSFKVPRGALLVVSYIGYKSQEITASERPITFTMQQSVSSTDEIVVIGYGTVRKTDLTGSLSQIKSKDITSYPATNIMQALNGRAPGVRVMQNTGAPGGSISVRIRGVNSILGGNEPLYVIDGFPFNGNPTFLQNSDIASIEILKDASSTAIYGSRGANGVVMITTKSGRKRDQTTVDVDFGYTTQMVTKKMPLMNAGQYAELYNEQAKNDGLSPYFTQAQVDSLYGSPGTDWQDLVLRNAPMYTASATVNGGTEKTKFSISGSMFSQDGIVRNSDYKRYNIRANVEHDISKVLSVNYNAILTRLNSSRKTSNEPGNRGNDLISAMLMSPPSLTPYLPDGSYRRLNTAYPFISNVIINPLVPLYETSDQIKGDRVLANAAVVIKPWKDLTIKISGGIENLNDRTDQYSNIEPSTNSVGNATVYADQSTSLLNENVITYNKQFGKHTLNVMGAFTYQDFVYNQLRGSGSGFLSDITGTGSLGSAATPGIPTTGYNKWVLLSYLGRLNYNYADKYLLTFSFRTDGSSRYSESNKWGNFPSAAIAWRVSSEDFLKQSRIISDLKLRASYGGAGSTAVNPYQTLNQLSASNTIFGDALYTAFAPGTTLPGDLRWETTRQFDAGMDISFLNNGLRFTADFYRKKTTNLLNNVQLPASMGYRTTVQNVGEIQNTGIELSLESDILKREVGWTVAGNIAFNRNKVLKLYDGQDIFGRAFYTGSLNDYVNLLREGQPLGIFYGYKETGYTDAGNIQYEDISKDGSISAADKTYIGDPNPDFIYGLNSITTWKGFELTVFIQGSQGNDIFNLNKAASLDLGMGLNLPREVFEDHWTPEKTNTKYPKITRNLNGNMSSRFVEDGSYLRFKNIQLAYNLPVRNFGWKWVKSAQVYASGQNLITFTKYSWYDPEVNAFGGSNSINQGIDYATYPTNKSVTFGLRCGF